MKKILAYTVTAILLGIVTMLAPFGLFIGKINEAGWFPESAERAAVETFSEETEPKFAAATQVTNPLNISFISFMLIFSLIIASSIALFFRRRMFGGSLP